jgi:hypothetical protein
LEKVFFIFFLLLRIYLNGIFNRYQKQPRAVSGVDQYSYPALITVHAVPYLRAAHMDTGATGRQTTLNALHLLCGEIFYFQFGKCFLHFLSYCGFFRMGSSTGTKNNPGLFLVSINIKTNTQGSWGTANTAGNPSRRRTHRWVHHLECAASVVC